MAASTLTGIFAPGSPVLLESLRTLVISPKHNTLPGETIRAEWVFSNLGGAPATGMRVRFSLPSGTRLQTQSELIDGVPLEAGQGFVETDGAPVGDLQPGASRSVAVSFVVGATIEDNSELIFQAALCSEQTGLIGSNIERVIVHSQPDLRGSATMLTLSAPDNPKPGDTVSVRATIVNSGQSSAHDLMVILPVPEHTVYVARSARIGGRVLLNTDGDPFDYGVDAVAAPRLTPGQSVVLEYQAVIESPLADGMRLKAIGAISSRECAEFAIASSEVLVYSPVNFDGDESALTVFCDDAVSPGMRVPMTVRAVNTGTGAAQSVSIVFDLPEGLIYTPGSAHIDGQPVGDESVRGSTFALGLIGAGRIVDVGLAATIAVPPSADMTLPIGAQIRWKTGERRFARTLTVKVAPRFTRARNYIEVDRRTVQAREDVAYTVHVFNDGTAPEQRVGLRILPGAFLEDIRIAETPDEPAEYTGPLELRIVHPHQERRFTVLARVASPVPDRSNASLGAVLELESGATDLGVGTVVVRSRPQLIAENCGWELLDNQPLRPLQTAQFVVRFVNDGSDSLQDARAVLELPPELSLERADGARRDRNTLLFGDVAAHSDHEARVTIRLNRPPKDSQALAIEGSLYGRGVSAVRLAPLDVPTFCESLFEEGAVLLATPADTVNAGERVIYELRVRNTGDGPAREFIARGVPSNLAVYVPGSTTVNGMNVPDDLGTSQLWSQRGLVLTDINPGVDVRVRFEMIVMAPLTVGTPIDARIVITWDGERSFALAAPRLLVQSTPTIGESVAGTPISIAQGEPPWPEFRPIEEPQNETEPASAAAPPVMLLGEIAAPPRESSQPAALESARTGGPVGYLDLTPDQAAQLLRMLKKSDAGGLLSHVFAIRAFFPQSLLGANSELEKSFAIAGRAVRAPLDRLFVRLKTPRLSLTAKDLEDRDSRFALRQAITALLEAPPGEADEPARGIVRVSGPIDTAEIGRLQFALESEPLGSVVPWLVGAHLMGKTIQHDGAASDQLGAYRTELIKVFSLLQTLPLTEFHRVLTSSVNRTLDDALAGVLETLRDAAHIAVE
ncbi:MAG: hypothetical protein M3Y21_08300 [Candidatus Eremiobacteraeota bacterium]|nr:hypothetical protein [Candidatus Eremiobacteraeota bacterium]